MSEKDLKTLNPGSFGPNPSFRGPDTPRTTSQENGKIKINTPENQAAFKWLQDIASSGCTAVGHGHAESRNTFSAGRAGVIFEGPWGRGLVENMSGKKLMVAADGDVWVAPMPKAPNGKRRTIGNPHEITISSKSSLSIF